MEAVEGLLGYPVNLAFPLIKFRCFYLSLTRLLEKNPENFVRRPSNKAVLFSNQSGGRDRFAGCPAVSAHVQALSIFTCPMLRTLPPTRFSDKEAKRPSRRP
jgi:hypothetical protein